MREPDGLTRQFHASEFHDGGTGGETPANRRQPPNEYLAPARDGFAPRLGRLPMKSSPRALLLNRFAALDVKPPVRTRFWEPRVPFPAHTFGNTRYGSCTISSQAHAALRMERLEQRRTTEIAEEEVIRVYTAMSDRLYGGGDNGAYETDALDNWRRPEFTFRDYKGRALTIDAYLRVNPSDHDELRRALHLAGAHGIKVCLNLPWAFAAIQPPLEWDIPEGQALTGDWMAGSWGGHSMFARDYDEGGIYLVHTWGMPDQRLSWRAAAAYLDEAHVVVESWNYWRTKKPTAIAGMDLVGLRAAVNAVSSQKIA
jgi:hypothetical protein